MPKTVLYGTVHVIYITTGPIGSATPENLKRSHEGNLVPLFSKRLPVRFASSLMECTSNHSLEVHSIHMHGQLQSVHSVKGGQEAYFS